MGLSFRYYPTLARLTSSSGSMGGFQSFVWTLRISRLALRVGRGKASSLSNRPGRRSAGSRLSGRFVAPITITFGGEGKGGGRGQGRGGAGGELGPRRRYYSMDTYAENTDKSFVKIGIRS